MNAVEDFSGSTNGCQTAVYTPKVSVVIYDPWITRTDGTKVTLSIGIAAVKPQRTDQDLKSLADRLLAEADAGLYRAKSGGRQRIEAAFG